MSQNVLEFENVSKRFCKRPELAMRYAVSDVWREMRGLAPEDRLRNGEFWALRDLTFELARGEVLGVLGHNGAGKSTLINLVAGLMRPTIGNIRLHTSNVALMDSSGGLNMIETGKENIATQLALHGCKEADIAAKSEAAIQFAELGTFIDAPVGTYSTGMKLRLAFSIYTCLTPDLFLVDEAIGGGDIRFRRKFQNYLKGYLDNGGSILFCSHEAFLVQSLCRTSILLETGKLLASGPTLEVLAHYNETMLGDEPANLLIPDYAAQAQTEQIDLEMQDEMQVVADSIVDVPLAEVNPQTDAHALDLDLNTTGQQGAAFKSSSSNSTSITSVRIFASDGGELRPGAPAEIEIVCMATEALDEILVSLEIGRGEEYPVATIIDGFGIHKYPLVLGENRFCGYIANLPLVPGNYDVRVCLSEEASAAVIAWMGYEDSPLFFTVPKLEDKEFNMILYRNNVLYVAVDWR